MAETIFAGEEIEKLAFHDGLGTSADFLAIFSGFAENFFLRYGPHDARNGECDEKQIYDLGVKRHHRLGFE